MNTSQETQSNETTTEPTTQSEPCKIRRNASLVLAILAGVCSFQVSNANAELNNTKQRLIIKKYVEMNQHIETTEAK